MNVSFKVFSKDKELEKTVLAKGSFDQFDWNSLRDFIIDKSKKPEFKSRNKDLRDDDDFILEFQKLPKNFIFSLSSIWNTKTYNYLIENLKKFNEKNPQELIKTIKMNVVKVDKLPKWELPKYDAFLRKALESTWKKEEEKIKKELNNIQLAIGQNEFIIKKSKDPKNIGIKEIQNDNIVCNSCLSIDFYSPRYVCSYCRNFNLCKKCFFLGEHNPEHNFILLRKPIKDNDITKYNNKFIPMTEIFRNIYDSFDVSFKVSNTGEKNLKNCYLGYIKFNGNYLYCEKFIVNEKLDKNESIEIKLKINFSNKSDKIGLYEGHFRMFTEKGEPFGDILKIRVKNDKK